jgi:hypothetical protein
LSSGLSPTSNFENVRASFVTEERLSILVTDVAGETLEGSRTRFLGWRIMLAFFEDVWGVCGLVSIL